MSDNSGPKIEEVDDDTPEPENDKTPEPKVEEPDDEKAHDDDAESEHDSDEDGEEVDENDDEEDEEDDGNENDDEDDDDDDDDVEDEDVIDADDDDDDFFGGGMFGGMMGSMFGGFPFGDFGGFEMGKKKGKKGSKMGDDGNGVFQCYSSSSTITTDADGRTRVRETTSSTRKVGNKLSETQKSVRDTGTGLEKMTLKRAIGDKERTVVKSRVGNGDVKTKEKLKGIKDDEKDAFDQNFVTEATKRLGTAIEDAPARKKQHTLALPSASGVNRSSSPQSSKKSSSSRRSRIIVLDDDENDDNKDRKKDEKDEAQSKDKQGKLIV